jgi:hypothetical protein
MGKTRRRVRFPGPRHYPSEVADVISRERVSGCAWILMRTARVKSHPQEEQAEICDGARDHRVE